MSFAGTDTARARMLFANAHESLRRSKRPNSDADVMTYVSTDSPKAKNGRVRIDVP